VRGFGEKRLATKSRISDAQNCRATSIKKTDLLKPIRTTAFDERIISDAREGLTFSMMRPLPNSCKLSFRFATIKTKRLSNLSKQPAPHT